MAFGSAAAADLVGLAHRGAERQLEAAGALDVPREAEHHRAGVALRADLDVLVDAVAHQPGRAVIALDVVDVAALAEHAGRGRERRADLGHAAPVFSRGNEPGLFAAHVAAGAAHSFEVEREAGAEYVLAEDALLFGLADRRDDALEGQR